MKTKAIIRSLMPLIGVLCGVLPSIWALPAHGQSSIPRYPRYSEIYAPTDTANRVPYLIRPNPGFYYYYDPVNRSYPFTPEPIWRAMFPGIRARIRAEDREFGTPGVTWNELAYWRAYRGAQIISSTRAAPVTTGTR